MSFCPFPLSTWNGWMRLTYLLLQAHVMRMLIDRYHQLLSTVMQSNCDLRRENLQSRHINIYCICLFSQFLQRSGYLLPQVPFDTVGFKMNLAKLMNLRFLFSRGEGLAPYHEMLAYKLPTVTYIDLTSSQHSLFVVIKNYKYHGTTQPIPEQYLQMHLQHLIAVNRALVAQQ